MKRRTFIGMSALAGVALVLSKYVEAKELKKTRITIRLLRHATLLITVNGKKIMVDPMLSKKEALDPVANAATNNRIPLVDLPLNDEELKQLLAQTDAVLITHTHRDHWDVAAQQLIAKHTTLFCQPSDTLKLKEQGFTNVVTIDRMLEWNGFSIHRTHGQHGTGKIKEKMGTVSGYVLSWKNNRVYIAGDTIWCEDVKQAIKEHEPTHIIVNGGGAQFTQGDPITMTIDDVLKTYEASKKPVTVVHLEAVNHCYQRRADVKAAVRSHGYEDSIKIPDDGAIFAV